MLKKETLEYFNEVSLEGEDTADTQQIPSVPSYLDNFLFILSEAIRKWLVKTFMGHPDKTGLQFSSKYPKADALTMKSYYQIQTISKYFSGFLLVVICSHILKIPTFLWKQHVFFLVWKSSWILL